MNSKGVGAIFCLISAILLSAWYIAAACYMSGASGWSEQLFQTSLSYVGSLLPTAAVAALAVGVGFLVHGFLREGTSDEKKE